MQNAYATEDKNTEENGWLCVDQVVSGYGKARVLHSVSLNVEQGAVVCLLGPNGAGKTTLMRTIVGLLPCWLGRIVFNNQDITHTPPDKRVRLGIAYSPEGRNIFANLTVLENLRMGGYIIRNRQLLAKNILEAFDLFPRLKERQHQTAGSLSGGEQQMLAIARALMSNPLLLLLDEPSLGLAPIVVEEIYKKIAQINNDKKTSILLVEQNVDLALSIAKHGYVLEKGEITLTGRALDLLSHPFVQQSYLGVQEG
ncbi:MAG: ABC transporter ATP-binding protein [Candidatus Bathyarchaeia archaeon]